MNKVELSQRSYRNRLDKATVSTVVNNFLNTIEDALASGDTVRLVGFGTFQTTDRKERIGVNPSTGEKITIPASKNPASSWQNIESSC